MKETPLPPSLEYERGYLDGLRADRTWVGLTDEEFGELWYRFGYMELMRAIEAKLKEKKGF